VAHDCSSGARPLFTNGMNWWKKIMDRRAWRKVGPSIEPARDWLILCVFFLVAQIVSGIGIVVLRTTIASHEAEAYNRTSAQAQQLDQKQLDLIVADHARRVTEFTQLQIARPAVVDPGI